MPGRTPRAAVEAFLGPLNESTCAVLPAVWSYVKPTGGMELGGTYTATLNYSRPVRVSSLPVELEGLISFTVVEQDINPSGRVPAHQRYKVSTRKYFYTLQRVDGGEVMAWHWHPDGKSNVEYPHLHIGPGELSSNAVLTRKLHVPSGRLAFEQVLLALTEMGAPGLHAQWREVVQRNLDTFIEWRTWP